MSEKKVTSRISKPKKFESLGLTADMPATFDFTKLDNYLPPERTREHENATWIDSVSYFVDVGEYFITADRCRREKPTDLEFDRVKSCITPDQHDAMYSLYAYSLGSKKDMKIVEAIGLSAVFKRRSLICRRGEWKLACVMNNTLFML